MTAKQARELEKATARARRDQLTIVARGTRKADGAQVYAVPSRSKANYWHLVVVAGGHLSCDCYYGKKGGVCAHRACVHDALVAAYRAALRDFDAQQS